MKVIYLIIMFLFTSYSIYSENKIFSYLTGIRGDQKSLIKMASSSNGTYLLLDSSTNEFENGNTFVKINSSIGGKNLSIILPETFTPNTLMEFLIKISTAKNDGALKVSVLVPNTKKYKKMTLNSLAKNISFSGFSFESNKNIHKVLWPMIREAGALDIIDNKNFKLFELRENSNLELNQLKSRKFSLDVDTVVDARDYKDFGVLLNKDLGLKSKDLITSKKAANFFKLYPSKVQKQVMYIVPAGIETNKHFFEFVVNAYLYSKKNIQVIGVMPYFHYARTDKKDQRGVAITGSLTTAILERLGVDALIMSRLHAPQAQGFFRNIPTIHVSSRDTIVSRLKSEGVEIVVSPDNGAVKESTFFADDLGVGVETINKQRDPISHITSIRGISNKDAVYGKVVAVIDDETASGGTGQEVAEYLKSIGAKAVIFVVTHLAGEAKKALNSVAIDKFIVTNTLPIDKKIVQTKNIEVLNIVPEMAREIQAFFGRPILNQSPKILGNKCSMVFLLASL